MDAMRHDVTKRSSSIDNVRSNVNRAANVAKSAIDSYNDRINNRSQRKEDDEEKKKKMM